MASALDRRQLVSGLLAAPAIVRASSLMPLKGLILRPTEQVTFGWVLYNNIIIREVHNLYIPDWPHDHVWGWTCKS